MPETILQPSSEDAAFSLNIPAPGEASKSAPASASSALQNENEIVVYTMPKEFIGAKGKKKKRASVESGREIPSTLAADSGIGEADISARAAASSKSRVKLIIGVVVLILFIGAGGAAGYLLLVKRPPSPLPPPPPPPFVNDGGDKELIIPEEPMTQPEGLSTVLSGDLIQKPVVSYNDQGMQTTEAVLSLEKEQNVNYKVITVNEYIVSEKPEYFAYVAGQTYEIQLRGEGPKGKGVLTITYSDELLETLDIIPADLRIGYMPFSRLKEQLYRTKAESSDSVIIPAEEFPLEYDSEVSVQEDEAGEVNEEMIDDAIIWDILKAQDLDDDIHSISSVLEDVKEGIYAIMPLNVNDLIELPKEPEAEPPPPVGEEVVIARDSDEDNLTDREELLYGTSPLSSDSDNDGYMDGLEVVNLYSPARGVSAGLMDDSQFSYYNNDAGYSFLHPQQFALTVLDEAKPGDIIMTSSEKETVVVSVQENPGDLTLFEWLVSISPMIRFDDFESFETREGRAVLAGPQKTAYYVAFPETHSVLVVFYTSPGEYGYTTTVRMMVESILSK